MRNYQKLEKLVLTALMLFFIVSCSKEELSTEALVTDHENLFSLVDEQPGKSEFACGYVDGNWSPTAYLSNSIGTSGENSFMAAQNVRIAAVWGMSPVPLRYVKDNTNPNSTFNAISYGSGKIYYGEAIYNYAKTKGQIVNVMVLAHEFGHQVQFNYRLPSKNEYTARAQELEADGMAGYYLKRPNGYNKSSFSQIASAYEFAALIGDDNVTSPNHHGLSHQRRSAVRLGFLLGNFNLSPLYFDYWFFYYYNGVLSGSYRQLDDKYENPKLEAYMKSHLDELKAIKEGRMSDEEYFNLD